MSHDPIKCLAATHIPIIKRGVVKKGQDWFACVDALAADIRRELDEARKDERAKVLASLGLREDGGCILNAGGTCVLVKCVRQ